MRDLAKTRQGETPAARTASDLVVERLRQEIVTGQIKGGTRIKLAELAQRYHTSAMPIREALRILEGERLVYTVAHRGVVVRPINIAFVRDVFEVRGALEGLLAASFALNGTQAECDKLHALAQACNEVMISSPGTKAMFAANKRFHSYVSLIGRNAEASALIDRGWPLIEALRLNTGYSHERVVQIASEHDEIVQAICDHDVDHAKRISAQHCDSARDTLIGELQTAQIIPLARQVTS